MGFGYIVLLSWPAPRSIYHLWNEIFNIEVLPIFSPFISHARKPQAFKPGDEWHPGTKPALGWQSGGESGIIWLWPDMPRDRIPSIGSSITWCGFRNIGNGSCEAK